MFDERKKQLKKFFMEYRTKSGEILQYQQEAVEGKLESVSFPYDVLDNTPDSLKMQMFKDNDKQYDLPSDENVIEFSEYLVKRGDEEKKAEVSESKFCDCQVWKDLSPDYFKNGSGDFPSLSYADVTEKIMFGYPEISSELLSSQSTGVWANYGYRIFHITIKGLPKFCSNQKLMVSMLWYRIGFKELSVPLFEEEIRSIATDAKESEEYEFDAHVDTHKLGELFEKEKIETNGAEVDGRFEVHIYENNGEDNRVYSFPIRIFVKNTAKVEICSKNDVSIDFGTSATCAAVTGQNKEQLITLSGSGKCEDGNVRYENPTNVMVYNWEELWKQWSDDNNYFPFLLAKTKDDESKKYADYDSGYMVERIFKSMAQTDMDDGRRKAEAVLKELKMIPFNLQQKQDMKFRSYNGDNRPVAVVDDWKKQDENHFDPVAFYGYLLGRAINYPGRGELFLKYHITYPEKFDSDVKDKIKTALTYGLKRSLPLPLREFVRVETKYSEPVACIGTILKHYVHLDESEKPKFFAVYDLGGGTMDFALAVLRPANDKEQEDDYEEAVTLLGVDGDGTIGGEPLIHELAYELYKNSKEEMESKKIKFFLPYGVNMPEGFEDILSTKRDEISEINVNLMKENLARKLFEYEGEVNGKLAKIFKGIAKDATTSEMMLRDCDNKEKKVSIEVKKVDEFLEEKIKNTIVKFKQFIKVNLENSKEKLSSFGIAEPAVNEVQIFLSGNASKQRYVEKCLKEVFGDNVKVVRIGDEKINNDDENKQYWVNEKTAVAFGQLSLLKNSGRFLDGLSETPRFQYTVGYEKDNGYNTVLLHGTASDVHSWERANRVGEDGLVRLYYNTGMDKDKTIPWSFTIPQEELKNGKILYLRIHDHRSVEYALGKLKEGPKDCAEVVEGHIVEVGKGVKENKEVE